ncbi:MAG: guanylate kinase [Cyclobacteriaceae bacterium]|nr:guanylate kinase [Cyclobacteriaceae bacterium]
MFIGKVIIFSAPSGSGKTTLVRHLLANQNNLGFSISATTRMPRSHIEMHGKDYYFFSHEEFMQKVANKEFIEWEEVYPGLCYGTLKSEIDRNWSQNKHVLFDVDVKGGIKLKKYFGEKALAIFVRVKDLDVLKQRLMARNTETKASLEKRIGKALEEMAYEENFDVSLLNDNIEEAKEKASKMINEFINTQE